MAETFEEYEAEVNKLLREHTGYDGDGHGGRGTLPEGDYSTAVWDMKKVHLRQLFMAGVAPIKAATEIAEQASIDAKEAAATATAAMLDVQGATLYASDLAALLANTDTYSPGTVFATRAEGYSYKVVESGAITTSGGVQLQPLPKSGRVTFKMYLAAGDGATDDTDAVVVALSDARSRGLILDGEGLTYRITQPLTEIAGRVENMTLDAGGITADLAWDMVGPEFEASKPITANARQGFRQLNVTGHGYQVGDVIVAQSDMLLETGTNTLCSHWAQIVSVTTNTITLSHALKCNLLLAYNPRIRRLPKSEGTKLRNITVIGSETCPGGTQVTRLYRPESIDYKGISTHVRGMSLKTCFAPKTDDVDAKDCDRAGLGYGLNVSGCGFPDIGKTTGQRCRHVLTFGGADGIPCVGGTFGDVIGSECLGSVFDTHPGAIEITGTGTVVGDMATEAAGRDAITMQSAGGSVKAKISGDVSRHVCLIQPFHNAAAFEIFPSLDADIEGDTANGSGIIIDLQGAGFRSMRLAVNGKHSSESVNVISSDSSAVSYLDISGSAISGNRAILVNQKISGQIGTLMLRGRFRTTVATNAVYIIGPTNSAISRTNIAIAGLDAAGGIYGLRVDNRADAKGLSAAFLSGSTGATVVSGGATIS